MKRLILITMVLFIGCAKKNDASNSCGTKVLQSSWTSADQSVTLGLSGLVFGFPERMTLSSGCRLDLTLNGTQCSGGYDISGSTYIGTGSDPGCASLNGVGTYTKSESGLNVCTSGGLCTPYH